METCIHYKNCIIQWRPSRKQEFRRPNVHLYFIKHQQTNNHTLLRLYSSRYF